MVTSAITQKSPAPLWGTGLFVLRTALGWKLFASTPHLALLLDVPDLILKLPTDLSARSAKGTVTLALGSHKAEPNLVKLFIGEGLVTLVWHSSS